MLSNSKPIFNKLDSDHLKNFYKDNPQEESSNRPEYIFNESHVDGVKKTRKLVKTNSCPTLDSEGAHHTNPSVSQQTLDINRDNYRDSTRSTDDLVRLKIVSPRGISRNKRSILIDL